MRTNDPTIGRTRCALTTGLLEYLYQNPGQSAIVGPYTTATTISGRVTNFNRHSKARGYHIKAEQHKVLALNPVTGESELMWEIKIVGAAATVNTPEKEEP